MLPQHSCSTLPPRKTPARQETPSLQPITCPGCSTHPCLPHTHTSFAPLKHPPPHFLPMVQPKPKPTSTLQRRFDSATIKEHTRHHLKHLNSRTFPNPTTNTRNLEGLNLSKHRSCHDLGTDVPTTPFTNYKNELPVDVITLHNKHLTLVDATPISLSTLAGHFEIKIFHLTGPPTQ